MIDQSEDKEFTLLWLNYCGKN